MLDDFHNQEYQKAHLREKIEFHKKNVILQSIVSLLLLTGGIYASQKKSPWLPVVIFPSMAASMTKLEKHESQRRQSKQLLRYLERT